MPQSPLFFTEGNNSRKAAESVPELKIEEATLPSSDKEASDKLKELEDEIEKIEEELESETLYLTSINNLLPLASKHPELSNQLKQSRKDAEEKLKTLEKKMKDLESKLPSRSIYDRNKGGRRRRLQTRRRKYRNGPAKIQRHRTSRVSRGKR